MPILPTYQGVSTSIATQNTPEVPLDTAPGQLKQLGQATEQAGNTFVQVMRRRQNLTDEATAMQRYMQADSDLQDLQDSFSKPDIGRTASDTFSKAVEQKKIDWFKDLTPGAAERLQQHLAPKLIEGRSAAMKMENRVHLNDYQATGQDVQRKTIDAMSRITDERDGKDTDEYKALDSYVQAGVKAGYYTPQEADHMLNTALVGGAQSRLLKLEVSNSIPEIDNAISMLRKESGETPAPSRVIEDGGKFVVLSAVSADTGKVMTDREAADYYKVTGTAAAKFDTKEEADAYVKDQATALKPAEGQAKSGGTFARHLDPAHRLEAEKSLLNRKEHLENAELARIKEQRVETERQHKEQVEAVEVRVQQKLDNPERYGKLTQDDLDLYADQRLISGTKYKEARELLTSRETSGTMMTGGRGDAATIAYFSDAVYNTRSTGDAERVKAELEKAKADGKVPYGQGQVGQVWSAHLDSLTRIPRDQDITPAKQTADAKAYAQLRLRTTGPMAQYLRQNESDAIAAINRKLDENAIAGYKEPPLAIVDRMLPQAQAQVGQPAQAVISERRRSMGLEITSDPSKQRQTREDEIRLTVQAYRAAPQGPEGDALRREAENRVHMLRELADLEDAQAKRKAAIDESRSKTGPAPGSSPTAPATKSGPLVGPKR